MAALDRLIPATWPAVWGDFARVFFVGLVNAQEVKAPVEAMARIALEQVRTLGFQLGGSQPYIPRGTVVAQIEAAEAVRKEFNGKNYGELAAKHDLSESRVRQILAESRR
ncbi:Mor transcription activator family protein [Acidovorax sp.]|uniref:Mor transcription activator family protein n=1 Tax=Acidovorax sp. TaxID=1872122 RepID=UPI0025BA324C|nr:Mor transcription activator family protein [Acidovorax sp.]